jgi:hypothetical protein
VTSESPQTRFTICIRYFLVFLEHTLKCITCIMANKVFKTYEYVNRPYSDGMGFGDSNVSATLDVTYGFNFKEL